MKTDEELKNLIQQGYKQTSRRYGTVVKLPEGVNENDPQSIFYYLLKVDRDHVIHMLKLHLDHVRRTQNNPNLTVTLSEIDLHRFRQLGGEAAR